MFNVFEYSPYERFAADSEFDVAVVLELGGGVDSESVRRRRSHVFLPILRRPEHAEPDSQQAARVPQLSARRHLGRGTTIYWVSFAIFRSLCMRCPLFTVKIMY